MAVSLEDGVFQCRQCCVSRPISMFAKFNEFMALVDGSGVESARFRFRRLLGARAYGINILLLFGGFTRHCCVKTIGLVGPWCFWYHSLLVVSFFAYFATFCQSSSNVSEGYSTTITNLVVQPASPCLLLYASDGGGGLTDDIWCEIS